MREFFSLQHLENRKLYTELLIAVGSLSSLFSESKSPFLYYRAMENIFCKSFKANNLSRSDISIDASKDNLGIGLKTFLKGSSFQKIAEFNKNFSIFKKLDIEEIIFEISKIRNERIEITKRICAIDEVIYHYITRSVGCMSVFEENMDLININNINIDKKTEKIVHFNDGINKYSFNMSKSTLFKEFNTNKDPIIKIPVQILEDPYNLILQVSKQQIENYNLESYKVKDYIVLPLYSPKANKVEERSGLNQWNAKGRERNEDEVYIIVPSFIHKIKQHFFRYSTKDFKTEPFNVKLPNGKILNMRIAQSGGKALMSNPNSELGKWILRDVLKLKPKELVTKERLDIIGIDSVMLTKIKEDFYNLDFLKTGSFEKFYKLIKKME